MRKANQVVFVFLGLVLCWLALAPSIDGTEIAKPDAATKDVASAQTEPSAPKFGTERELVFQEAPKPEREARQNETHYQADFVLLFRCPVYSDVSTPIETTNTRSGRVLPEIGEIINQISPKDSNPYARPKPKKVEHWLRTLAGRIDKELQSSEDLVDSLRASSSFDFRGVSTKPELVLLLEVRVRDDKRDILEKKVRALTLLIDKGLSPQCHEGYLAAVKLLEQHLDELGNSAAEREERHEEMKREQETLDSVKDLSEEALSSLIAHKHLLSVKRAGIRARLEASKEILATGQNEQVQAVIINAHIELAGIEAEAKKVDEIIASRMKRTELEAEIKRNWSSILHGRNETREVEKLLAQHQRAVAENWACPEVSEIQITTRPGRLEPNRSAEPPWWER